MTKEALIAAGLTEEQAIKVLALHQSSIDGNYIPKVTFEAERDKVKTLNTQITDRDKQIAELGSFKGTAEQLQAKVTALEASNKTASDKFAAYLLKAQQEVTIRMEILNKVVDVDDVLPKLDITKVVFKDGKIESGLTEQLDTLKKAKPHYFKEEGTGGTKPNGWTLLGNTHPAGSDDKGTKSEAELFGIALAKQKQDAAGVAAKAADHYFK